MTIKDNPIDPTIYFCDEDCQLFRWNKCRTDNKDGTCDKPDRYDNALREFGDEEMDISLGGGKSLKRSWDAREIEKQLEEEESNQKKSKSLLGNRK